MSEMWPKLVDTSLGHNYQLADVQKGWISYSLDFHLSGENEKSKINKNLPLANGESIHVHLVEVV